MIIAYTHIMQNLWIFFKNQYNKSTLWVVGSINSYSASHDN